MATRQDEGDAIELVYKAAVAGCVSTLNKLIETSPLILRKFSLTTFTETPLHVSALLGHHDFTRTLLTHNPNLAKELDSYRRSPLHLASAEGHEEIVQVLLHADHVDVCLFHDQDGRIPLHYSAMRGRLEVLKKLIRAKPESIFVSVLNRSRETALHLCVKYNQLECLKLLVEHVVEHVGEQKSEFLNSKDTVGGQTILHLALVLKQTETIRYLLSIPIIREKANDVIRSYVLEHNSGDSRNLELQKIVIGHNDDHHHQQPLSSVPPGTTANVLDNNAAEKVSKASWRTKLMKYPTDWLEETRGMLIVVAGMIATMTFQAAVNPPGGVWQENNTNSTDNNSGFPSCTESQICYAGTAVLAYGMDKASYFDLFMNFNTISFLASLSVTLLLISGFPLHNRLCMWLLSMGMCIVLSCLALSYLIIVNMIIPNQPFDLYKSTTYNIIIICVWILLLLAMVVLIHTLRVFIWLGKRLRDRRRFRHN